MRKVSGNSALSIFLSALLLFAVSAKRDKCPATGNATDEKEKRLNAEKNRSAVPAPDQIERSISITAMLHSKDKETLFDEKSAATVEGYLYAVEKRHGESCNCNSTDPNDWDYALYLSDNDKASSTGDCVIAEITPNSRKMHPEWSFEAIKKMQGKRIIVTGWMLFNYLETKNSFETHPMSFKADRRTVWEIHPVTGLKTDE